MLDFYFLGDDQNTPNYPTKGTDERIGHIDYAVFQRLKAKKIIPERFDYHTDFRWDGALIQQILVNIQKHTSNDADVKPLLQILNAAQDQQSGLIAYAD